MKKLFILGLAMTFALSAAAQEDETDSQKRLNSFTDSKRNEVSLDVISALAIPAIDARYEYVLGRYSGVGADLFVSFYEEDDDDYIGYNETFAFTPYYRQYFFSKEDYGAKGFYGEGFLKFYTYEIQDDISFFNTTELARESYFETAFGVGIGWKWVSDSGFLIDLNVGFGRSLGISDPEEDGFSDDRGRFTGRGGLNFGWRF